MKIEIPDEIYRQARAGAARAGAPVEDWIGLAVRTLVALQLGELPAGRMNPLARPLENKKPTVNEDGTFSNQAAVDYLRREVYDEHGRVKMPPPKDDGPTE